MYRKTKQWVMRATLIAVGCGILMVACVMGTQGNTAIPQGHEGVFVKKAYFGKGGIDMTPAPGGQRVWHSPTTDLVMVDLRPQRFEAKFDDLMTADNAPIDFSAYAYLQVAKGKGPALVRDFGNSLKTVWKRNLEEQFRAMVRRQGQTRKMNKLTIGIDEKSKKPVMDIVAETVHANMVNYIKEKKLPVHVVSIQLSKATPAGKVIDAMAETMAEQQRSKTEIERGKAEMKRKDAEEKRAIADMAYRRKMNLSAEQYIRLEQIRAFREVSKMFVGQPNTHLILSPGGGTNGIAPAIPTGVASPEATK